jgi:hypothetical protein
LPDDFAPIGPITVDDLERRVAGCGGYSGVEGKFGSRKVIYPIVLSYDSLSEYEVESLFCRMVF